MSLRKPRIRSGWLYWTEPPGADGVETLRFASCDRQATFRGEFLRELARRVLPRLDGRSELAELQTLAAPELSAGEVLQWLERLHREGITGDELQPLPLSLRDSIDLSSGEFTVVLLANGDAREEAAELLRAARVDSLRQVDELDEAGCRGAQLVLSLLDASWTGPVLNAAAIAWAAGVPFLSCRAAGSEIALGALAIPGRTPCFLCQEARGLAAAEDPAFRQELLRALQLRGERDWFARQTHPETLRSAARLAVAEALRFLLSREPRTLGRLLVFEGSSEPQVHRLAPVPGCRTCGAVPLERRAPADLVSDRTGLVRRLETNQPSWGPRVTTAVLAHRATGRLRSQSEAVIEAEEPAGTALRAAAAVSCAVSLARTRVAPWMEVEATAIPPSAFSMRPHAPDEPLEWIAGRELPGGRTVLVPAQLVRYPLRGSGRSTSSGLAAAATFEEATAQGLFDVCAHHAFLHAWLSRRPPPRVEPKRLRPASVDLLFLALPAPLPVCAVACMATAGDLAVVTAAAAADPEDACEQAMLRAGAALEHERRRPPLVPLSLDRVQTADDHAALFHGPQFAGELSFLRAGGLVDLADAFPSARPASLDQRAAALGEAGSRVVSVEITTPELRSAGLGAVRVLVTGLLPLHHGYVPGQFPHPLAPGRRLL